jgi:16S rRNA (cytosine967-C5)-methyltransferase
VTSRAVALAVLGRVFDEGAFADRAFRAEADRAGLDPRERAFAQQLVYGAVQRCATLDHLIAALSSRPVSKLDPRVRDALRLGLFQLLFLGGVADHAAVSESVELAKGRGGDKLVNAVLRRAQREGPALLEALSDDAPDSAAVKHSHPDWLVRMWWDELGADETRALLARDNEPPESAVRVNTLRAVASPELVPVPAHAAPDLPEGLVLEAPFDVHASEQFARGELMPQSRASMTVSRVLDPQPGERVLDLCAAPGAKTTHIAALMEGRGEVVAVEAHPGRAEALEENCRRLGAGTVRVLARDARERVGAFDRVLLDPPCSDLGTLQSRPDLRWRKDPELVERLAGQQSELLEAAAEQVRPGGVLVYSTCTISARENEERMKVFLSEHGEFRHDRTVQLLPHRDGTDGFFIARLERGS